MRARAPKWGLRFAAVTIALAFVSCTDERERVHEPTPSEPAATTIVPPTTAQSPATTRTPRDTSVFDAAISKLTFSHHTPNEPGRLIAITPYFVVARLKSVAPSELYSLGTIPQQGWVRGVSLTLEVTELRPLPASANYAGRIETGLDIVVDYYMGAYTSESNRAAVDDVVRSVIDAAPLDSSFAMFIGPTNKPERWMTNGPQGWAYLDDDGRFTPVRPLDPNGDPSWWPTYDLSRLRALLDEATRR